MDKILENRPLNKGEKALLIRWIEEHYSLSGYTLVENHVKMYIGEKIYNKFGVVVNEVNRKFWQNWIAENRGVAQC